MTRIKIKISIRIKIFCWNWNQSTKKKISIVPSLILNNSIIDLSFCIICFINNFVAAPYNVQLVGNFTAVEGENITIYCNYSASIPAGNGTELFIEDIGSLTSKVNFSVDCQK